MFTKVKNDIEGTILFETEYTAGKTYCTAKYLDKKNKITVLTSKDIPESLYHVYIREEAIKNNYDILDGTIIEDYDGGLPINEFNKPKNTYSEQISDVEFEEIQYGK